MNAHQKIMRSAELFEEKLEGYLIQRGWKQIMIGWYWVWTKSCKLKNNDGEKQYSFNVTNLKEAWALEKILYELTFNDSYMEIAE